MSCDGQWCFLNRDEDLASTSEDAEEPTEWEDEPKPDTTEGQHTRIEAN